MLITSLRLHHHRLLGLHVSGPPAAAMGKFIEWEAKDGGRWVSGIGALIYISSVITDRWFRQSLIFPLL
jgi:hypothetical protein